MRFLGIAAAVFCFATMAMAESAIHFPPLTGRVVDNAHLLTADARTDLEEKLADHEKATGDQIVVVTVPSLEGMPIEDYTYRLGRYWGIGQKDKDNGIIFLIAPAEQQIRIEVGYGLEGKLTDVLSSQIIQTIVIPDFKAGAMEQGIVDGTQAILDVLGGKPVPNAAAPQQHDGDWLGFTLLIIFFFFSQFFLFIFYAIARGIGGVLGLFGFHALTRYLDTLKNKHYPQGRSLGPWLFTPTYRWNGSQGGGFGGGGFSGGGGSFGGGGSSGRW